MKSLKEKIEAAAAASEKALAEKERLLSDLKVDPKTRNPRPETPVLCRVQGSGG